MAADAAPSENSVDANEAVKKDMKPAGFWRRVLAMLIDIVVIIVLSALLLPAAKSAASGQGLEVINSSAMMALIFLTIAMPYFFFMYAIFRTTVGKAIMHIRLTRADARKMGFGQALVRSFGYLISMMMLGGGFLFIVGNKDKRALHDFMAGTFPVCPVKNQSTRTENQLVKKLRAKADAIQTDPALKRKYSVGAAVAAALTVLVAYVAVVGVLGAQANAETRSADASVRKAALAAEPKTDALTQVQKAKAQCTEAKACLNAASLIRPQEYGNAKGKAQTAKASAESVLKQVRQELAVARKATDKDAEGFRDLFAFYKKYPRTPEAAKALQYAEASLKEWVSTEYESDAFPGIQIAIDYMQAYPAAKKPTFVGKLIEPLMITFADENISYLQKAADSNASWVTTIRGGETVKFSLIGHALADKQQLEMIVNNIGLLGQSQAMVNLYNALNEASAISLGFKDVANNPSSQDGNNKYFNDDQISQVEALDESLLGKVNAAKAARAGIAI